MDSLLFKAALTIYGIKNCDTMKKAFTWLKENNIEFTFFDYKKEQLTEERIAFWLNQKSITELINTKGTTFKKLTDEQKLGITNVAAAKKLMLTNTSMIRRPLVDFKQKILLGFNAEIWAKELL